MKPERLDLNYFESCLSGFMHFQDKIIAFVKPDIF